MASKGTTSLATDANPPRCITAGMWGLRSTSVLPSSVGGQNVWLYNTTDSSTDLVTANWFVDAFYIGMRQGDMIMGTFTTGSSVSAYIGVIGAVTTNGANIASSGGQLRSA
jgi:hypothetical protein